MLRHGLTVFSIGLGHRFSAGDVLETAVLHEILPRSVYGLSANFIKLFDLLLLIDLGQEN